MIAPSAVGQGPHTFKLYLNYSFYSLMGVKDRETDSKTLSNLNVLSLMGIKLLLILGTDV